MLQASCQPTVYHLVKEIDPSIFRAYDIRGRVDEALTPNSIYTLGRAIALEAHARSIDSVLVGRDGRLSSPILSQALCQGLLEGGCHVTDLGLVPTPVLYFAASQASHKSGVMLTGSHNPAHYNGIKLVLDDQVLAEEAIQALYQHIVRAKFHTKPLAEYQQHSCIQAYIDYITQRHHIVRPLKVIIDCGHGVAAVVAPQLFKALGCELEVLYGEVDGNFPSHHPDPSKPENLADLIAAVKESGADIGLAFDGDGDRLGVVDECGNIIWPDRQLMLFAQQLLMHCPQSDIVFDVKCSRHLGEVIEQAGGVPIMWKTGHALLRRKLKESAALLAGEMSGHIYFNDEHGLGFDDGLYAAVRLLEILARQQHNLSAIFAAFPHSIATPELAMAVADEHKMAMIERLQQQAHFPQARLIKLDGLRVEFEQGWGLVRASNTSPNIVFRFEAEDAANLATIQQLFKQQLLQLEPSLKLPF